MSARFCKRCQAEHPLTTEHWYRIDKGPQCKVSKAEDAKNRRALKGPEMDAKILEWRNKNKDRHLSYMRSWRKNQYENNPRYKLVHNLRNRLRLAIRGKTKPGSTIDLLGCSIEECKIYLELKFRDGMTWGSYGRVWEVDHIIPLANYDVTQVDIAKKLFHYTNLQPLLVSENRKKSNKEY